MSEELKYLLSEIKDSSQDYIGTNGCRYQDLLREELDLLVNEIERLNNIIGTKDEGINALTEDLCETAKELEEATNTIKMALDYIQNAEGNDINYVATLLLGRPIEIEEKREQVLTVIGGKRNE